MSTINDRIVEFITTHGLTDSDELRNNISDFVSGCWADHFKVTLGETIPNDKIKKVSKENKIEEPSECKNRDELRNCTSGTLNEFCKKQGLRVGGNKTEIMDRVWRYLQGNNSEEDMSPRNKPKKEKKANEKHDCYGCTSKGTPCAVAATVEVDGCWFCWRHEETAQEIIANKQSSKKEVAKVTEKPKKSSEKSSEKSPEKSSSKKSSEKKKLVEDELRTDDSEVESSTKKKSSKKKIPEPEPEPELESESEEEVDSEQQETDDEN